MIEERIPEATIEMMREQLLGKRVSVSKQKFLGKYVGDISGICDFFGYNKHIPEWGLQITIDRLPISNVKISQIKLLD